MPLPSRVGSRLRAVQASVYGALAALATVLLTIAPVDADGNLVGSGSTEVGVGMFLMLGLMSAGCTQQVGLRRDAYGRAPARLTQRPRAPEDPAIVAVLAARAKRARAREIAASDPLMARELRIGRPDLRRTYDDGGLVDLNNAPARAIARICELDPGVARAIVEARTAAGGFLAVDDVFTLSDIPVPLWPVIRDRGVVITI